MTQGNSIPVHIGEVKIGREGDSLNAILGSCIGLGFLFPKKGIYGLAHCLLAKSEGPAAKGSGRHVDQAIDSLLSLMDVHQDERRKVKVFLAGGANMTLPPGTNPTRLVGSANSTFARKALRDMGLRVAHEDVGGDHGRRVTIDCSTGEFNVDHIPRLGAK